MRMFSAPVVAVLLVVLSPLCLGYTAPSELKKFHSVLNQAKLQAPNSKTAVNELFGHKNSYFHLQGNRYMQFQMNGKDRRSELRQMKNGSKVKAAWDVRDSHSMTASIAIPKPDSKIDEATFLQVHCTQKPALRISWKRSHDGSAEVIVATRRTGTGSGYNNFDKQIIAKHSTDTTAYEVKVHRSRVTVKIDERTVFSEGLGFWEGKDCFFKAGVYIQNPDDNDTKVRMKFAELDWN